MVTSAAPGHLVAIDQYDPDWVAPWTERRRPSTA